MFYIGHLIPMATIITILGKVSGANIIVFPAAASFFIISIIYINIKISFDSLYKKVLWEQMSVRAILNTGLETW